MDWRDKRADASRRQADYAFQVLGTVLAWAADRGKAPVNPCERGGKLYRSDRSDKIWSDADEGAFLAKGSRHLHLPLLLALWTGQRQGDLLRLPWSSYDGTFIRLRQRKTSAKGLTFLDLRGTAVTRLALTECTHAEIATITGHGLREVSRIIDAYLHRDPALAVSAVQNLETRTNSSKLISKPPPSAVGENGEK